MIMKPDEQPAGTQFYVTRRPDPFWEFCAPCEELVSGPYEDFETARGMLTIARKQLERMALTSPVGVLAIRPALRERWRREGRQLRTRFPRGGDGAGEIAYCESPTRFSAAEITAMAVERGEPVMGPPATGFELIDDSGQIVDAASMTRSPIRNLGE